MLGRFFSSHGRSPVMRAILVVLFAVAVGWIGIVLMRDGSIAVATIVGGVLGATAAKLGAELARRRHDRNARGRTVTIGLLLFAAIFQGYVIFVVPQPVFHIVAAVSATGLAWVLLAPGDQGENAYGPPARTPFQSEGSRGTPTAAIIGLTLTLSGAVAGFGGATLLEEMSRRHVENERGAE